MINIETMPDQELRYWDTCVTTANDLTENELLVLKYLGNPDANNHHANWGDVDSVVRTLFDKGLVEATLMPVTLTMSAITLKGERVLEIYSCFNTLTLGETLRSDTFKSKDISLPQISTVKPTLKIDKLIVGKTYRTSDGKLYTITNLAKQLINGVDTDVVIYTNGHRSPCRVVEKQEFIKDAVPMKEISVNLLSGMDLDKVVAEVQGVPWSVAYTPTTNWGLAGPIVEAERIELRSLAGKWVAFSRAEGHQESDNILIAAMRAYIKSKLGGTVLIPDLG